MDSEANLTDDEEHANGCHRRWSQQLNRNTGSSDYQDDWFSAQCGGCRFFITLDGALGSDYGACTNSASPFDRKVMFEHDGCEQFVWASDGWGNISEETTVLRELSPEFKNAVFNGLISGDLSTMNYERRELGARIFETIGQRAFPMNGPMIKKLNRQRANYLRGKSRQAPGTLRELVRSLLQTEFKYQEGDSVLLKPGNITHIQHEGVILACYDVIPAAYEVGVISNTGQSFSILMYDEELEAK